MTFTNHEKTAAIITAAGESRRMGGRVDKLWALLGAKSVLARVIEVFNSSPLIGQIIVMVSQHNLAKAQQLAAREGWSKVDGIYPGGIRRQDSVALGLSRLKNCEWVVIHDGARPLVTPALIETGLAAARETGAAIAACPVSDTIKLANDDGFVKETVPRQNLWAVQTPQVFRYDIISDAYKHTSGEFTDDASLVEKAGHPVRIYMGDYSNIKITTPSDLKIAQVLYELQHGK